MWRWNYFLYPNQHLLLDRLLYTFLNDNNRTKNPYNWVLIKTSSPSKWSADKTLHQQFITAHIGRRAAKVTPRIYYFTETTNGFHTLPRYMYLHICGVVLNCMNWYLLAVTMETAWDLLEPLDIALLYEQLEAKKKGVMEADLLYQHE